MCVYVYNYYYTSERVQPSLVSLQCTPTGRVSLYRYVLGELSRGYLVEKDEAMFSEKQRRVLTFMKTPRELEKVHVVIYILIRFQLNISTAIQAVLILPLLRTAWSLLKCLVKKVLLTSV